MDIVKLVRDWVKEKYTNDNHPLRSEYWIKKIDSYAGVVCTIAAISHDIERAFSEGRNPPNRGVNRWG